MYMLCVYINVLVHAYQASFLQEKALGYKIIIIVKRTAAPFGILSEMIRICVWVYVYV